MLREDPEWAGEMLTQTVTNPEGVELDTPFPSGLHDMSSGSHLPWKWAVASRGAT